MPSQSNEASLIGPKRIPAALTVAFILCASSWALGSLLMLGSASFFDGLQPLIPEGLGIIAILLGFAMLAIRFSLLDRISSAFDSPWKRVAFLTLCIPIAVLIAVGTIKLYYDYHTYNDERSIIRCHGELASQELDVTVNENKTAADILSAATAAAEVSSDRLRRRSSSEVRLIEQSPEFQRCLSTSSYWKASARFGALLTPLFIASGAAVLLILLINPLGRLGGWVRMK